MKKRRMMAAVMAAVTIIGSLGNSLSVVAATGETTEVVAETGQASELNAGMVTVMSSEAATLGLYEAGSEQIVSESEEIPQLESVAESETTFEVETISQTERASEAEVIFESETILESEPILETETTLTTLVAAETASLTGMQPGEVATCQKEHFNVEFRLDEEWISGYNATITIKNTSEKPIGNWYLDFNLPDEIQNLQCGTILLHEGNRYLVKNAEWNQSIPVGGSVSITFTAAKAEENVTAPQDYSMDVMEVVVPQENYTTNFVVQSDWGTGFTSNLVITNISGEVISDWRISFDFAGEITTLGGGNIVAQNGTTYYIENLGHNQRIQAGECLYIQIIGSRADSSVVPQNITLKTMEYYVPQENPENPQPETSGNTLKFDNSAQEAEVEKIRQLNGGELPVMYLDEDDYIPNFITGRYSVVIVTDYETAVQSLYDVTNLMCIDWDTMSFEGVSINSYGNRNYYRLQQMYHGVKVEGNQLIVATDEHGNITALSGDFDPLYDFGVTPSVTEEDAKVKAAEVLGIEPESIELVVYRTEESDDILAWNAVYANTGAVINAVDGEVISKYNTDLNVTEVYEPADEWWDVPYEGHVYVDNVEGEVFVRDNLRNMEMKVIDADKLEGNIEYVRQETVKFSDKVWISEYMKYFMYTEQAYDFYKEILNLNSFSNKNDLVTVYKANYNSDNNENNNNGFSNIYSENGKIIFGYIIYATMMKANFETAVHEYSHLIQRYICQYDSGGYGVGTIYEAYSDIMAELAQIHYYAYDENDDTEFWKNQFRDIVNGTSNEESKEKEQYSLKYSQIDMKNNAYKTHQNSVVLSHAFYKMYMEGFNDIKIISELIYRSIFYFTGEIKYEYCYPAIIQAATDMKLTDEQVNIIRRNLEEAELVVEKYDPLTSFMFDLNILDFCDEQGIKGADIKVLNMGSMVEHSLTTNHDGEASINVSMNQYKLTVYAKGYIPATYELDLRKVLSDKITIKLIPDKYVGESNSIIGTVTDISTGKPVEGATVIIKEGFAHTSKFNQKDGYCVTDSQGRYEFTGIETGYYTIEIKKDGYVTEYLSTWSVPQVLQEELKVEYSRTIDNNVCLYPVIYEKAYRIVLKWSKIPKDLDAHLICRQDQMFKYHVYYSQPTGKMDGKAVTTLDVDQRYGYGPETITIIENKDCEYEYYVNKYSIEGKMVSSGAMVIVYYGNERINVFEVGKSGYLNGDNWYVLKIVDGKVIEAVK